MELDKLGELLAVSQLAAHIVAVESMLNILCPPEPLNAPAKRVLKSGGKRLRPILVLAAASLSGNSVDDAGLRSAVAIEMVHQSSLVHDDIIDKHGLRRGVPTITAQEGEAVALLVGDYWISSGLKQAYSTSPAAGEILADAVGKMCIGQALELNSQSLFLDKSRLIIASLKTGALFSAAVMMGGIAAGLGSAQLKLLNRYGRFFGMAFQILDDLADEPRRPHHATKGLAVARQYLNSAAAQTDGLADGKTKAGLALLPDYFLKFSQKK